MKKVRHLPLDVIYCKIIRPLLGGLAVCRACVGCRDAAAFKKERKKTNEKDTCYFCAGGRTAG